MTDKLRLFLESADGRQTEIVDGMALSLFYDGLRAVARQLDPDGTLGSKKWTELSKQPSPKLRNIVEPLKKSTLEQVEAYGDALENTLKGVAP